MRGKRIIRTVWAIILTALLAVSISSCGLVGGNGNDCDGGGCDGKGTTTYRIAEYYPLGQGDTWTYSVDWSSNGDSWQGTETRTVSGTETIDGVEAVIISSDRGGYNLWT